MKPLTPEAKHLIANVDGRFYVVHADGRIHRLNAFGKYTRWSFTQLAAARAHANRLKANVFDKLIGRFVC